MTAKRLVAHVSTVHHPLDPRIFLKEVGSLRGMSLETWLIARDSPDRGPIEDFLALTDGKGILRRLRRHFEAYRHLRELKPNVIHFHDPELIPLAYVVRRLDRGKVVYDMHEDYAGRKRAGGRLLRALERWCFRWVDHVVLAESSYESILRGRSTPSTTLLNYVSPPAGAIQTKTEDRPTTLIYAGTISNCRGLRNMLDLAREIKRAGLSWRIRIVGVSHLTSEREEAQRRIDRENLSTVIERVGWDTYVPWSSLVAQYADADFGLALFEPLPNHTGSILSKFYEYIYFKLPVVYSGFPLWEAFFGSNGCGVSVDPTDPKAVLTTIRDLVEGEGYARLVAATARSQGRYEWAAMEPRLRALYEDLLD